MSDSITSLLGGLPKLREQIARSENSVHYSCSVARIGDPQDFERLPASVTRVLVTIEYLEGHSGLTEESLQRTLADTLGHLGPDAQSVVDLNCCPVVAALERTPEGACCTILCNFQSGEALQRLHDLTLRAFTRLVRQSGLKEDECLWVSAMKADTGEYIHLLTRTSRMTAGSYPVLSF